MKLTGYVPERLEQRVMDKLQDYVKGLVDRFNELFITSDRIARRQIVLFKDTAWAAANTALAEMPFFTCPFDIEVFGVAWCGQDAIAVNAVDYREFSIKRCREGVAAGTIATRNTGSNGNAISAFVPWALVNSSDTNILRCKEGDVLTVAMPEFGTGPAVGEGGFTIDYDVLREVES